MSDQLHRSDSEDKWRCSKCFFDNLLMLPNCEICDEPNAKEPKKMEKDREWEKGREREKSRATSEPGIDCPSASCKEFNSLARDTCSKCGKDLFPEEEEDDTRKSVPAEPKKELAECRSCGYSNDPLNEFCVSCEKRFRARIIRKKTVRPRKAGRRMGGMPSSPCPTCGEMVLIVDHATGEIDICMACQERHPTPIEKNLCLFCDSKLSYSEQKTHDEHCDERRKFFSKEKNPTFDRCTALQHEVMTYMHRKCERLHYRREKQLISRVKKLGYSGDDLQNLHHYIIHYAPIIIHMHVNTHFHFFVKDTNYRNQFETNKSSGSLSHSARTGWEDRMFDRKHHGATAFERVKYGTMNFTNDPQGVRACAGYGNSYFLLKPHMRDRCTITDMDSSSASASLGTFRFMFHVLMKLSDAELKCAFEGSKGKEMKSNVIGSYKEIQIHGPVQFARDVERVYISKNELKLGDAKGLLEQVKSFCSQHSLEYQLFENEVPVPMAMGMGIAPAGRPEIEVEKRIVGDKTELTEEDLKPPPAPVAPIFGGGGFGGGFGGGIPAVSLFAPPVPHLGAASYGASHFAFGAPVAYSAPPPKRKEFGLDYI